MTCPVSEQIAMHADEPEQISVCEILRNLIDNEFCVINGDKVALYQITDSIDEELLRESSQELICGNGLAIYQLYIKALEELIND